MEGRTTHSSSRSFLLAVCYAYHEPPSHAHPCSWKKHGWPFAYHPISRAACRRVRVGHILLFSSSILYSFASCRFLSVASCFSVIVFSFFVFFDPSSCSVDAPELTDRDEQNRMLLLSLLRAASEPYLGMVRAWMEGGVLLDPYDEFGIKAREDFTLDRLRNDFYDTVRCCLHFCQYPFNFSLCVHLHFLSVFIL